MSKLFLIAIIALAVIGVTTGAIEVKVNSEKLRALPATIQGIVGSQDILSQTQYYLVTWKRKAELAFANSDDKKFDLYMKYVEADTKNLKTALDSNKSPGNIITQSRLLKESVDLGKGGIEKVSEDAISKVRDNWLKVLGEANTQLQRLSSLAGEYKKYQEQLENLAPESVATPTVEATPAIPLKF